MILGGGLCPPSDGAAGLKARARLPPPRRGLRGLSPRSNAVELLLEAFERARVVIGSGLRWI